MRQVLQNTSWLFAAQVGTSLSTLLQGILVPRAVGLANYGYFVLIISYTQTIHQLISSRVWELLITYIPDFTEQQAPDRAKATLKLGVLLEGISALAALIILLASADFAAQNFTKNDEVASLYRIFALITLLTVPQQITAALLRLDNRFRALAMVQFASSLILLALITIGVLMGMSLRGLIIIQVMGAAAAMALHLRAGWVSVIGLGLDRWWRTNLRVLDGFWRKILWFLLGTNLLSTTRLISTQIDVLLLGWIGNADQVGAYGLARRIARELNMMIRQLLRAMQPEIARMIAAKNTEAVWQFVKTSTILLTLLAIVGGIALNIAAYLFIPIFFGDEFADAVPLAAIMLWIIVSVTTLWYRPVMLALGRPMLLWVGALVTLAVLMVGLLILVPRYESTGAAIASLIYYVADTILAGAIGFWALRRWRSAQTG